MIDALRGLSPSELADHVLDIVDAMTAFDWIGDPPAKRTVKALTELVAGADPGLLVAAIIEKSDALPQDERWIPLPKVVSALVYHADPLQPELAAQIARGVGDPRLASFRFPLFFPRHFLPSIRCQSIAEHVQRANSEIKSLAGDSPVRAAEGAVLLIEVLVEGALRGTRRNSHPEDAITVALSGKVEPPYGCLPELLDWIVAAEVSDEVRRGWAERLAGVLADGDLYLYGELGKRFAEVCGSPAIARAVAPKLAAAVRAGREEIVRREPRTSGDLASLLEACVVTMHFIGDHDEVLALTEEAPHLNAWRARSLGELGRVDEALELTDAPGLRETLLYNAGRVDEALEAARGNVSTLASFEAAAERYGIELDALFESVCERYTTDYRGPTLFETGMSLGSAKPALELARREPQVGAKEIIDLTGRAANLDAGDALELYLLAAERVLAGRVSKFSSSDDQKRVVLEDALGRAKTVAREPGRTARMKARLTELAADVDRDGVLGRVLTKQLAALPDGAPGTPQRETQKRKRRIVSGR